MIPQLVLYIGLPKTGTTTIQTFLSEHRGELRTQGWDYPVDAPGFPRSAHFLPFAASGPAARFLMWLGENPK